MSYDISKLQSAISGGSYKSREMESAYGNRAGDAEFSFLRTTDLGDYGQWKIRFLPSSPDKNPDGFLEVAQHWINPDPPPNKTRTYSVGCLRPEPCYICDLLEAMIPVCAGNRVDPATQDAIAGMDSRRQVAFLISIFLTPHQTQQGEKRIVKWGPEMDKEHGALLMLRKPSNLLTQAFNLLSLSEDLPSLSKGRYLTLTKKINHMTLESASGPCPLGNQDLLKLYPDLSKRIYGKKFLRPSYGEMETVVAGCWFASHPAIQQTMQAMAKGGPVYSQNEGLTSKEPEAPVPPPAAPAFTFAPAAPSSPAPAAKEQQGQTDGLTDPW